MERIVIYDFPDPQPAKLVKKHRNLPDDLIEGVSKVVIHGSEIIDDEPWVSVKIEKSFLLYWIPETCVVRSETKSTLEERVA